MDIRIESNFPFSVTSIQYAPDGELRITLSSENMPSESRYQYTASLGRGHSDIGSTKVYADLLNKTNARAVKKMPAFMC